MTKTKTAATDALPARQIKWYGCKPDISDHRDRMFAPAPDVIGALPPSVDLREHCPPVMDQGNLGSCTAHGITAALRYALIKSGQPDHPCARLQLYYDERAIEGSLAFDSGAEIRDGIQCAATLGVGHEDLWPYVTGEYRTAPPPQVYADALKFEALTYERVQIDPDHVKAALAAGFPVIIGVSVFSSFEGREVAASGDVPMPGPNDAPLGGHCMIVVGYGQRPGTFTVQNSWGSSWGDGGFCYFPEAYLGSAAYGNDYWTITSLKLA